jgi:hypothetical protein
MHPVSIEKELISLQPFINREVLSDVQAITERRNKLARAVVLGNLYKVKSRICFETQEGSKVIETTIWSVTNNYVIIKGGQVIPVRCITGVE